MGEVFVTIVGIPKRFPPDWYGELPPPRECHELAARFALLADEQGWSPLQFREFLDYRTKFHQLYYIAPEGRPYHRACNGGSLVEVEVEGARYCAVYCAKCGLLPSFPPPSFVVPFVNGNGR